MLTGYLPLIISSSKQSSISQAWPVPTIVSLTFDLGIALSLFNTSPPEAASPRSQQRLPRALSLSSPRGWSPSHTRCTHTCLPRTDIRPSPLRSRRSSCRSQEASSSSFHSLHNYPHCPARWSACSFRCPPCPAESFRLLSLPSDGPRHGYRGLACRSACRNSLASGLWVSPSPSRSSSSCLAILASLCP